jgi:methionyl-tRNA formyltransferase
LRLVFLGTSKFALPSLRALHADDTVSVEAVISRPDKPAGRGRKLARSPVALLAQELGIRLLQPEELIEVKETLAVISPGLMVSASYGGWLPGWLLSGVPKGVVNIHPSLLPRHRGAAPVIRTILEGDRVTGVAFMLTDHGWDTGDIIQMIKHDVSGDETAGELEDTLAEAAARVLPGVLADYASGALKPQPQSGSGSYAEKISTDEAVVSWSADAEEIRRTILAFNPVPGARTYFRTQMLKIFRADVSSREGRAGLVLDTDPLLIGCGQKSVRLLEVQPQGKRRMSAGDYARGCRIQKGDLLGEI